MVTCQQARQAASFEHFYPVEEATATDPQLLGDLLGGELAAGRHPHGQKPLVGFYLFAVRERSGHRLRKLGVFQMKSLGYASLCHSS